MTPEEIARVAHEANRGLTQILQDVPVQPSWDLAPQDQRESVINGVNFHLVNPDAGASASHDNWMQYKFAAGWVFGEKKSEAAKTHPALRPYAELPEGVRKKDAVFRAIVQALR